MMQDIPLSLAGTGSRLLVTGIHGGTDLRRRLAEMGLSAGSLVSVVSGCHPGPLLIDIKGSRVGLGFGTAQKIMVKEEKSEEKADHHCACR